MATRATHTRVRGGGGGVRPAHGGQRVRILVSMLGLTAAMPLGCGDVDRAIRGAPDEAETGEAETGARRPPGDLGAATAAEGVPVKPPFAVRGELEGLMLVWFDGDGAHPAERLSDVPEGARSRVRIDSLTVPPGERLPPDQVYVADLRTPDSEGAYPVRQLPRAALDAELATVVAAAAPKAEEVVIYKASWCGVCKQAASYLRGRNVPFVERDVEKDPGADAEMRQKAAKAGKSPRGVPVIDFRGQILLGFDRRALEALIDQG